MLCSRLQLFPIQGFQCFLDHLSVLGFNCSIFCLLRHDTISSRCPLFNYLFITSLLCSRLRLFHLLFVQARSQDFILADTNKLEIGLFPYFLRDDTKIRNNFFICKNVWWPSLVIYPEKLDLPRKVSLRTWFPDNMANVSNIPKTPPFFFYRGKLHFYQGVFARQKIIPRLPQV